MRAAPDLDWSMDCVPVDEAAQAIARLARAHERGVAVAHVTAERPRHWRECVLWMRLSGYDIDLVPYSEWMEMLRATGASNPLHALRSFFLHTVAAEGGLTLPELFEESRRATVEGTSTRRALAALAVVPSQIDAGLLDRYFDDFERTGRIARAISRRRSSPSQPNAGESRLSALLASLPSLIHSFGDWLEDSSLSIESIAVAPVQTDESIVAELTSWRAGGRGRTRAGLFRAAVTIAGRTCGRRDVALFVKSKAADQHVIDVAESVAALASPALGEMVARFREHLGFTRSHLRELAVYAHPDPRLRAHTPRVLGVHGDDTAGEWVVALEAIDDAHIMNASDRTVWHDEAIDAAIAGLARLQAVWFERRHELAAATWLAPLRDARRRTAMLPLWSALASHACDKSPSWADPVVRDAHERLVGDVDGWARTLDAVPQTLIHNDFNPRNIAIRGRRGALSLCAFDWELATLGAPQRDLAELLCFVLPVDAPRTTIARWVERHRSLLEGETGTALHVDDWDAGFRAALCDLLVDRLASYAMVDRIRRQRFLPRVVSTWANVYRHYPREG